MLRIAPDQHDKTTSVKFSSSFSLTRYLPLCSSRCLPTFPMWLAQIEQMIACVARATPINSLAT